MLQPNNCFTGSTVKPLHKCGKVGSVNPSRGILAPLGILLLLLCISVLLETNSTNEALQLT